MKTLIAYATQTGTTEKAAEMIADKLKAKPDIVNIGATKTIELSGYDFILVGGSIRMGKVNKAVRRFLANNKQALMSTRFGLFLACGYPEEVENYYNVILDEDLKSHVTITAEIGYAYYLDEMGPIARKIISQLASISETTEKYNLKAIQAIADVING
ncbi:MAG: flavodoxin domain-containing protein [Eubacteriales bacterium]